MKLRQYAAFVTGFHAELLTALVLWAFTQIEVCELIFLSGCIGLLAAAIFWGMTEPKDEQIPDDASPRKTEVPQIYTFEKVEKGGETK